MTSLNARSPLLGPITWGGDMILGGRLRGGRAERR